MIEFLTALLVVLTGVYAYLTYRILGANRAIVSTMHEQITASVRPYVYFDLVSDGPLIEARLRNSGLTAAHVVRVSTLPELRVTLRAESTPAKLTHNPIALLAPGREIVEFIASWEEFRSFSPDLTITGTINYTDSGGRRYEEQFRVDLSTHEGMTYIGRPDPAEQLKLIAEHLQNICRQFERHRS